MISSIDRVISIGKVYEDLENLHNVMQVCVDSMQYHNVLELDSVKQVLISATEKAYAAYNAAKEIHDEMLAELKDGEK
ncbi:MAG: hypothetical protein L3K52_15230 [Candidatus Thiothrix sulfatifontis]|nr:MAG: hypothetical protein L3K52_15230 [Candidatus Thiothrix sulfatifontis]